MLPCCYNLIIMQNFTNNLIDAISQVSKEYTGGFLKEGVFHTKSLGQALAVAYLCKNSIIDDSNKKGYNYKVFEDK